MQPRKYWVVLITEDGNHKPVVELDHLDLAFELAASVQKHVLIDCRDRYAVFDAATGHELTITRTDAFANSVKQGEPA